MNIYGCSHKRFSNHQMRFTTKLLEHLETIENVGKFFLLFLLFGLSATVLVLLFLWWAFKSRLL